MRGGKIIIFSILSLIGLLIFAISGALLVSFAINTSRVFESDTTVTIERGPCFGFCPIYTATVNEDGEVKLKYNERFEGEEKTVNYEISKDSAKAIMKEVDAVKFFDLNDKYEDPNVTDLPSTTITVTKDGKTKSIYMFGLDNTIPEELILLGKQIDNYLNIDKHLPNPNVFPGE